jgi:hypothetical protein
MKNDAEQIFELKLTACQRDDAIRDCAVLANAFQDLYNEIGEIQEIKTAYKKVERVISEYAGLQDLGLASTGERHE